MEKLLIRNVLYKFGMFRSALAVGVGLPLLAVSNAFAQGPGPSPTPAPVPDAPIQSGASTQPTGQTGRGEATTERVIVTGSYIPTAETESALPVTVYTAAVLQKQGANTPAEGLRQLPSFVGNAATENNSNGGTGAATINLRAVGSANTLILLNGRRTFNFRDVNAIGIGSLERTEVLKDGASAVYGSDAVAGVVNFILLNGSGNTPYEGAEVFALYGNTTEKDAHVRQVYVRGGVKTDKVAIAAAADYYDRADIFSRDRAKLAGTADLTNSTLTAINPPGVNALGRGGLNTNSEVFAGRVSILNPLTLADGRIISGQLVLRDLSNNQVTPGSYRRFEPNYPGSARTANPPGGTQPGDFRPGTDPSRYNFRTTTPAIPGQEKYSYYITGEYKIFGEGMKIYGDVMYSKEKTDNGLAAAPFTITSRTRTLTNGQIAAGNGLDEVRASQFNPFGANLGSLAYRTVNDLGSRRTFYDKDFYRYVAGLRGDFNLKDNTFISRFGYDTGIVYERFDQDRIDSGDARRDFIRDLIAPIGYVPPAGSTPLGNTGNRGTFNPFIGQSAPLVGNAPTYVNGVPTGLTAPYNNAIAGQLYTDGGAAYVAHSLFRERDWLADAKINMHLFPGFYNGGIELAVGYEHRELHSQSIPDPVQLTNQQLGFNQAARFKFEQKVDSVFAELGLPLVTSTMNIPGVKSLEVDIAFRYEKFRDKDQYTKKTAEFDNRNSDEDFGGTPRISLRYQPISDLTLRASFGQSFLSPGPGTLFQPTTQNFPRLFDPVQSVTLQPPGGVSQQGNPGVTPEKTDTYTAGLVYTPSFLKGFTVTADVYQLYTTNLILGAASFAQVLLTSGTVDPDGPILEGGGPGIGITRNPDGTLRTIDSRNDNAGARLIEGLDVTAAYQIPTARFGTFTLSGGYNHFFIWKAGLGIPGFELHNFLGDYNNGTFPLAPGGIPFNKAFLRGEWEWKGFDFIATGNYIGDYEDDPRAIFGNDLAGPQPGRGGTQANPNLKLHHRVSDYETLDLQLAYEFKKPEMQAAAAGYSKDAKDAKSAMSSVAGADSSSIWQRLLWDTRLTVGVNNVFDRYPPTVLGAFNDNYDTSNYSIRNRYYYVSIKKKF
ncbi:MAG: TonB-dependent receptor domain-containing protein [Chthoniobacterales bacterium]